MICSNCGKRIKKTLIKCPFCGARVINKESFELPQLKPVEEQKPLVSPSTDNKEIIELSPIDYNLSDNDYGVELDTSSNDSKDFDKFVGVDSVKEEQSNLIDEDLLLGKTIRIDLEEESSLMDDISSEIEKMAEEDTETIAPSMPLEAEANYNDIIEVTDSDQKEDKSSDNDTDITPESDSNSNTTNSNEVEFSSPKESIDLKEEESISDDETLSSKASIKKRRKIFIISILSVIILTIVIYSLYRLYQNTDHTNTTPAVENQKELEQALTEALEDYYVSGITNNVVAFLETIKDDEDKVSAAQAITKEIASRWVTTYYEKEIDNKEDFEKESVHIKELLNNLHTYGIVKKDDTSVKSLKDSDYQELINKVNDIYNDSVTYFDAYELYNQRDYNKAYATFDKIESNNRYYSKSLNAKARVVNDVILLLQKDIEMLETDIDSLNNEEKLALYIEIEEIIFEYKNVYHSVALESDEDYQALLKEYSELVDKYSEITTTHDTGQNDDSTKKETPNDNQSGSENPDKSNDVNENN